MRFDSICRDRSCRVCAITSVVLAIALAGWTSRAGAQSVFRSSADLVALQVSVVDPQKRYVSNLDATDFTVYEEGQRQTVSLFATGTAPLDIMLLVDTSASMFGRLPTVQRAAINFVRALTPEDRAAVVLFNHRVSIAQALTSDRLAVERVIDDAVAHGGTALHEALYIALRHLERTRSDSGIRRQAIVVLTDGDDNDSHVSFNDVMSAVRGTTVTIYTIVPPLAELLARNGQRPVAPYELRALADESGGRLITPQRTEDLASAYSDIAEELSHQYWLAFAPTTATRGFRRVAIRMETQPVLRARTRSGYHAGASRASVSGVTPFHE